jgi:hypothetical protein
MNNRLVSIIAVLILGAMLICALALLTVPIEKDVNMFCDQRGPLVACEESK